MVSNDLVNPRGKGVTGITLVTGFLSKGDKISNDFCWCEKAKQDGEKCLSCYVSKYISKYFAFKS